MAKASIKQARRAPDPQRRREEIADAALKVLGSEGSRGLTHRAVDEVAGLPSGSTSISRNDLRALILGALEPVLAKATRGRLVARYELTLESTRRPELHAVMDELRSSVAELTTIALRRSGCNDPDRHARQLVVILDGITIDQVGATSPTLDRAEIERLIDRFLDTC